MFLASATLALLGLLPLAAGAQGNAAPDPPPLMVSSQLRPVLSQVSATMVGLDIRHWKAPGQVRDATQQDVSSIQHDLSGTLSGLLAQADAAPGSVAAAFSVYRNIDALYDTLLRVVLTANLAAPENEASTLQSALSNLESARVNLGDSILNSAQTQQSEFLRMRAAIAAAEAEARRQPTKTTVIDDGPVREARREPVHHHTTARKPTATKTPAKTDNSKPNPQ
jgi:hypothetical protein